jgi:hypothetical protein
MHGDRPRHITNVVPMLPQAPAEVGVLPIEKIVFVEPADCPKRSGAN